MQCLALNLAFSPRDAQGRSSQHLILKFRGLKAMASAEREPITGAYRGRQNPQRGPGRAPAGSGVS